jgi:signal transduction histidine kinase
VAPDARMSLEDRRQFYLIAKEAVNNIARHSGCRNASVNLRAGGRSITLEIRDDGAGFSGGADRGGDGIENMKRRAAAIGGHLTIASAPGQGTSILLRTRIA